MRRDLLIYSTLSSIVWASFASQSVVTPLFATELGATKRFVGWTISVASIATILTAPLVAKYVRKKMVAVKYGFLVGAVGSILLYMTRDFIHILYFRFIVGIAFGATIPLLIALASEINPESRGSTMGVFNAISSFGWALGSLASGFIADVSNKYAFLFSCILMSAGFALSHIAPEREVEIVVNIDRKTLKKLAPTYATFFFRHTCANGIWAFFPLFFVSVGATKSQVGFSYFLNMMVQAVTMGFVGRMTDKLGRKPVVRMGIIGTIFIFIGITLTTNIYLIYLLQAVLGFVWSCLFVGITTLVADQSEWETRGQAMAGFSMTRDATNIVGPILGGIIFYATSFSRMIFILLPLVFVAYGMTFLIHEKRSSEQ
jgi:MFS family permease